jgi:outer membrane receptor protein involved in Fe transport
MSGVASYHHPITDGKDLFSYVSYRNAWDGYTNHDNFQEMDNPETVDFRLGLKSDNWKFVGFVDNLTDNRYISYEDNETQIGNGGRHWGIYAPGRTYGIQVVYRFN